MNLIILNMNTPTGNLHSFLTDDGDDEKHKDDDYKHMAHEAHRFGDHEEKEHEHEPDHSEHEHHRDHEDGHDEHDQVHAREQPTPVEESGLDIDTAMPYGELEPFGREDTAQELTED